MSGLSGTGCGTISLSDGRPRDYPFVGRVFVDVETGGVLIGYIDDSSSTAVIVKATEPGPNATRIKSLFVRDNEFIQAELDRAVSEYGSKAAYIGEWHSHLNPDANPAPLTSNPSSVLHPNHNT